MGHEHAVAPDQRVESAKPVAVTPHAEVRHPPDALAQDVDHGSDVEEVHPAPGRAQVGHDQTGTLGGRCFAERISFQPVVR